MLIRKGTPQLIARMDKEELNAILLLYLVSNHAIPFHSLKFISIQNEGECNFRGGGGGGVNRN